jgi:hypothetical protein
LVSFGSLKVGCFPHGHFLLNKFTIVSVLQETQQIPLVSFGSLKDGRFPHLHNLLLTSTMVAVLHDAQQIPFG